MPRCALVPLLAVAILLGVAPPAWAGERWRRPLPGGSVVGAFSFQRAAPYERGRRRGIDLSGRRGAPVLAACSGTVAFAGRVPRHGRGVTLRCGRLVATELGLSVLLVARGARVRGGAPIGALGRGGRLRLGARVAADRHGYLDPLTLLQDGVDGPVAPPAIPARRRRRPLPTPRAAPAGRRATAPSSLPWPAGVGLALLAASVAGGGVAHRRRREHGRRAERVSRRPIAQR